MKSGIYSYALEMLQKICFVAAIARDVVDH